MKNIKLVVEYDGTDFAGWQMQKDQRTVEGELKKALDQATGEDIDIIGAGRTDKGVHARGQVINFRTKADIPGENYKLLMDYLLPEDISIFDSQEVGLGFHARFDSVSRDYSYLVYRRRQPNPILRNFTYHFYYDLDIDKMKYAANRLIGTHDFTAFKTVTKDDKDINMIRTLEKIDIIEEGEIIRFEVKGKSFLYNMVRIIVGTLLYIGCGKIDKYAIDSILTSKNREEAGITAAAQGLYLDKVHYK